MIKPIVMLLGMSLLTGCTTLFNSGFECSKVGGQKGCVSLNEVNRQSGEIVKAAHTTQQPNKTKPTSPQFTGTSHTIPQVGLPVRLGESVQKILLFDYIDKAGNYHEPNIVYTILHQPSWQKHATHEIQHLESI